MSGLEIFGAVAAAISLTGYFIKVFGTRRNTPREVERLRNMLEELQDMREDDMIRGATESQQMVLAGLINQCTDMLQQRGEPTSRAVFFWSAKAEEELRRQNDQIENRLTRLCARLDRRPWWHQCVYSVSVWKWPMLK